MHHLSILAVRRPIAIIVFIIVVLIFGGIALPRIGIDLLPDMNLPIAVIVTVYPNAQAEVIEQEVTTNIEASLSNVSGIRRMDSFSMENISALILQFDWNTNMLEALDTIRSNLAQAALNLPSEVQQPVVARIDPNESPLMLVGVTSPSLDTIELTRELRELRPLFEQVPGVAEVSFLGASENEIQVLYDPAKLAELDLTASLLEQLIRYQNMVIPGGTVTDEQARYNVRTGYRFESVEQLGDLAIGQQPGEGLLGLGGLVPSMVYLSDVADISVAEKEREGITRLNGSETVMIRIMRQSGANTVRVANQIRNVLAQVAETHPEMHFTTLVDQSQYIISSVRSLIINGLFGGLLALIILYLFLRSMQSLLVIAIVIPISIVASFIMIYLGNLTLNLMTLGGLALALGMLVDSSIVVLENIYRHRIEGKDNITAAQEGSREIAAAIIASTTTTLAVFLPVVYVQSIAGELLKELGLTVSFSLIASLLVALTVVPMLTSKMFRVSHTADTKGYGPYFTKLQNLYVALLEKALEHRRVMLALIILSMVGTGLLLPQIGDEFFPPIDEGYIGIQAILPSGVPMERTEEILADFERQVLALPEVQGISVQAGEQGDSDIVSQIYGANLYNANIQITLKPANQRNRTTSQVSKDVKQIAERTGIVRTTVMETSLLGSNASVLSPSLLLEIRGENPDILASISEEIMKRLKEYPGFGTIQDSRVQSINDLFLEVDPARSIMGGLTSGQIGLAVRQATTGIQATKIYVDGHSLPVIVRPNSDVKTVDGLLESQVTSPVPINGFGNSPVQLGRVVEERIEPAPPSIQKTNRLRVINVTAQLGELDLTTAARIAQEILEEIELPTGYFVEFGGLHQLINESKDDLYLVLTLAVILIYLVMAAQFESFVHPLTIICTVPLASVGAIFALWITGNKLGITALIGAIVLAGIVVNNAIVLVDYINLQRRQGFDIKSAILEAGKVRLRPILMTVATTILGLLPLALGIGEGSEIQAPLAVTVIGGLTTSTLLTLFVIPVAYATVTKSLAGDHLGRSLTALDTIEQDVD